MHVTQPSQWRRSGSSFRVLVRPAPVRPPAAGALPRRRLAPGVHHLPHRCGAGLVPGDRLRPGRADGRQPRRGDLLQRSQARGIHVLRAITGAIVVALGIRDQELQQARWTSSGLRRPLEINPAFGDAGRRDPGGRDRRRGWCRPASLHHPDGDGRRTDARGRSSWRCSTLARAGAGHVEVERTRSTRPRGPTGSCTMTPSAAEPSSSPGTDLPARPVIGHRSPHRCELGCSPTVAPPHRTTDRRPP